MRANRTYATTDSDLVLEFECNGEFMGSVIELDDGDEITCSAHVSDESDTDTVYLTDLISGDISAEAAGEITRPNIEDGVIVTAETTGDGEIAFDPLEATGDSEFFFVRVEQGDGDEAWSAPVWVNHTRNYEIE